MYVNNARNSFPEAMHGLSYRLLQNSMNVLKELVTVCHVACSSWLLEA